MKVVFLYSQVGFFLIRHIIQYLKKTMKETKYKKKSYLNKASGIQCHDY